MNDETMISIVILATAMVASCAAAAQQNEEALERRVVFGLQPGVGRELVIAHCVRCHSAMLISKQHQSRASWDRSLANMMKEGLQPLPVEIRTKILDYLVTTQGPKQDSDPRRETPWALSVYHANPLWN